MDQKPQGLELILFETRETTMPITKASDNRCGTNGERRVRITYLTAK